MSLKTHIAFSAFLFLSIAAAYFVFYPAITGPFVLDDFIHLPKLGYSDGINDWNSLLYLISTHTSATGRPISFLSLLIDDNAWPTSPESFKHTNILIHLLNGVLVLVLSRLLLRKYFEERKTKIKPAAIELSAMLSMIIWLIHPLQLSTMMLVIQRMTLLMSFFSLLALISYCYFREKKCESDVKKILLISVPTGMFIILSILAKESGIIILMYILAIELTIYRKGRSPLNRIYLHRFWLFLYCLLPIIGILFFYLLQADRMEELWARRSFNMGERLLTQARVLTDYMQSILIPSMSGGPFNDDYTVSRSFLSPTSTLPCIIFIYGLIGFSLVFRKKFSLLSFSILWFFFGHFLESTFLPLELYFEHRNYLPALGFCILVGAVVGNSTGKLQNIFYAFLCCYILLAGSISYISARTWGNDYLLPQVWAEQRPKSARAQIMLGNLGITTGDVKLAEKGISTLLEHNKRRLGSTVFAYYAQQCVFHGQMNLISEEDINFAVNNYPLDFGAIETFKGIIRLKSSGGCDEITYGRVKELILSLEKSGNLIGEGDALANMYRFLATIYVKEKNLDKTIASLDSAYKHSPRYDIRLQQAYYLIQAGLLDEAEKFISEAEETPPFTKLVAGLQAREVSEMHRILDLMKKNTEAKSLPID